jgi:hypothetical protein
MKTLSTYPSPRWVTLVIGNDSNTTALEVRKQGVFLRIESWDDQGRPSPSVTWAPGVQLATNDRGEVTLI